MEMLHSTDCGDFVEQGAIFVINNVFCTKNRKDTIVVGYVEFGEIHLSEEVDVVRNGTVITHTMVTGIELAKKPVGSRQGVLVDMVSEGVEKEFEIGLLLSGIEHTEVRRGDIVVVRSRIER